MTPSSDSDSDYDYASKVWDETHNYDAVLRYLRDRGVSKLDSIKALHEFCGVSLGDAKRIAARSAVWQDTLAELEKLHNTVIKGATAKEPTDGRSC